MNPTKQFWTLFKFQALSNRYIWTMSVVLLSPQLIILGSRLDLDDSISNMFMVMALLPAMLLLTPEKFSVSGTQRGENGFQFLLTRAIDRHILYRSKAALLYLTALLLPVAFFLFSMINPDLQVALGSNISADLCLSHIYGSTLVTSRQGQQLVFIPDGKLLTAGWHLWALLIALLAIQLVFLARFKSFISLKSLPVVWKLICIGIWAVLILRFGDAFMETLHSTNNRLFFSFAAHPFLFWLFAVLVLIPGQLWCERRFTCLEQ